jgi:uncharacterized membrane protein
MTSRAQFGISTLMWVIVAAAVHCWLFSHGPYVVIVTIVVDKHILVAYLCLIARVDRTVEAANQAANRRAA